MADFPNIIDIPGSILHFIVAEPTDQGGTENILESDFGENFIYKMRAVDDAAVFPGYVFWKADFPDYDATQSGSSTPPIIGTLVPGSIIAVTRWRGSL